MIEILLYVSSGLIILGYVLYLFIVLIGRSKIVSDSDGFDVTKDIISEYDSINIIENNGYFTVYNIKRKVIKLATKCYYGKDISSVSLALTEAGISVVDNKKNKYIDIFRVIFNNLKLLYIFPLIALFINNSSFSVNDAKVSIFIGLVLSFISYILIEIKNDSIDWVSSNLKKIKNINKDNRNKIINFMNRLILFDKFIYFGELIMVIRLVLIMLEIN